MDEGWADLESLDVEGDEVQLVQEDLLVVETDPGGVRLLPHSPLDVPVVSGERDVEILVLATHNSLEKVFRLVLHVLGGLPAQQDGLGVDSVQVCHVGSILGNILSVV